MTPMTFKQFKVMHPELVGVKLVPCSHIKSGEVDAVDYSMYAGPYVRFVLCPVCTRVVLWDSVMTLCRISPALFSGIELYKQEYEKWIKESGAEKSE